MIIFTICLILVLFYIFIKYKILKIRKRAPECYHGHPLFEFLSGFFDKRTNPQLNINENKIPNKPCLFLMNHVDVSDPLFILQIIKMQKPPRKLIYVATTEYHKYPIVKKILEEDECIFVEFAEIPEGVTSEQAKMTEEALAQTALSLKQKELILEYQHKKQQYADQVISQMVDRLKSGYNVFIFPTGTFDHYNHKPDMVRRMRPGAAKAIVQCISKKIDIDVLIIKKLGVPKKYAGSFFWSLPYMLLGGSRKVKLSLEAVIPIEFFKHQLIQIAPDPIKMITALYASYMSTEDLVSSCGDKKLNIQPIKLTVDELGILIELRKKLESQGYTANSVKDPRFIDDKNFGYTVEPKFNPFLEVE